METLNTSKDDRGEKGAKGGEDQVTPAEPRSQRALSPARVGIRGHPSDAATVTPGASTCVHCSEPTAVPGWPVNRAASGPKGISSSKIKGGMISRQQDHEGAPDPG